MRKSKISEPIDPQSSEGGFGNDDKGIGAGSDQITSRLGSGEGRYGFNTLLSHFVEYDGPSVNQTTLRLIYIQVFAECFFGGVDAKIPFVWKNDIIPASAEVQLGERFSSLIGTYLDGLLGIGNDRIYDWGVGLEPHYNY